MSKEKSIKKEPKTAKKSVKEKKAAKQAKKDTKGGGGQSFTVEQ